MQFIQTSSLLIKRTIRATVKDANKGDGTSSKPSNTSEDTLVSPPLGTEVASDIDPTVVAMEENTMDWTVDTAI